MRNGSCDCNRSNEHPYNVVNDDDEDSLDYICCGGDNVIIIEKIVPKSAPDEILYAEKCGDGNCECHWNGECKNQNKVTIEEEHEQQ